MRRRTVLTLALGAGAGMLVGARAAPAQTTGAETALALVETAVDRVILPDYRAFASAAKAFETAAASEDAGLDALRQGYHAAMDAWQAVQAIRFGPIAEAERHFRVQFWPDKRNLTARHLAGFIADADPEMLEPERFAAHSIALQGFPALERLLFEDADALTGDGGEARYCRRLVRTIAANLAGIGAAVVEAWPAHRDLMLAPGDDNPVYRTAEESLRAVHAVLANGLERLVTLKLEPLLVDGPEDMRPRRAESWRGTAATPTCCCCATRSAASAPRLRRIWRPRSG